MDPANIPDLGALKNRELRIRQSRLDMFIRNGLICPCGEYVRDQGVVLFQIKDKMVPTNKGKQLATQLSTVTFHSRDCPELEAMKGMEGYLPICIREAPQTEWLEEGILDTAEGGDSNPSDGNRSE